MVRRPREPRRLADRAGRLLRRLRSGLRRLQGRPDLELLRHGGLNLGRGVFIGAHAWLDPDFCFLITIEDDAVLSIGVTVLAHDASTRQYLGYSRLARVHIGARAFLGTRAVVLPGVTIGEDAIVGAGSVVRQDVPPRTVVAGTPARVITTLDAYLDEHRARLPTAVRWEREGHTAGTGISPETRRLMLEALEAGEAYIR